MNADTISQILEMLDRSFTIGINARERLSRLLAAPTQPRVDCGDAVSYEDRKGTVIMIGFERDGGDTIVIEFEDGSKKIIPANDPNIKVLDECGRWR